MFLNINFDIPNSAASLKSAEHLRLYYGFGTFQEETYPERYLGNHTHFYGFDDNKFLKILNLYTKNKGATL